jgi:PD-(D/E)XK nuclease superfamily
MKPTVVRVSTLSRWHECERKGATGLFWHEIEAAGFRLNRLGRGIAPVQGSTVHKAAAFGQAEKAQTGALPPLSYVLDVARDELVEQQKFGSVRMDGPRGVTHNWNDATAQVAAMSTAYHQVIAPLTQPVIVETRFEAEIEQGLILSGQPDLICHEPAMVRDLKTGTRPPASWVPQLGGYSLVARSHHLEIDTAAIDFVRKVARGRPQPIPETHTAEIAQAETAAAMIVRSIATAIDTFRRGDDRRGIKPGDPWAFSANPACVLCSPKYCSAYNTSFCREGVAAHGS